MAVISRSAQLLILSIMFTAGGGSAFKILFSSKTSAKEVQKHLTETNLSDICSAQLQEYTAGLLQLKPWALLMLDGMSKIPSGLMWGNIGEIGDFDECLEIETNSSTGIINGRYCLGSLNVSHLQHSELNVNGIDMPQNILFGVCFPNACSAKEMQEVYSSIGLQLDLPEESCQDKLSQAKMTTHQLITLTLFGIILGITIASTAYDCIADDNKYKSNRLVLTIFSIRRNGKQLLEINNGPSHIPCVDGIRALSMMWIMIGHKYMTLFFGIANDKYFLQWLRSPSSMIILESMVAVDTFLLMAGLMCSYSYMNTFVNGKTFSITKHYMNRYVRLTPTLGIVILFHLTMVKYCGSGPYWNEINTFIEPCQKSWLSALLYIQNYVNPLETCVPQSWYLSVDTQLFLMSPLLLIPLRKHPKYTLVVASFLIFFSILSAMLTVWFMNIREATIIDHKVVVMPNFLRYYYQPTHTRAAVWLIGFILGYLIYQIKQSKQCDSVKQRHRLITVLAIWGLSLTVMVACVFGGHGTMVGSYKQIGNTLRLGMVKPMWATAVAWIIFACVKGYGGIIDGFLSLPPFQFLAKLSYSMYLTHVLVINVKILQIRRIVPFDNFGMMYGFWADYMFTMFISIVLVLLVETPCSALGNFIIRQRGVQTDQSRLPMQKKE